MSLLLNILIRWMISRNKIFEMTNVGHQRSVVYVVSTPFELVAQVYGNGQTEFRDLWHKYGPNLFHFIKMLGKFFKD